ncbi:MAG: TSUP family transporter [Myxococcales bacterium]|nr:TSUP family transporter [Myxococcales bacterium]
MELGLVATLALSGVALVAGLLDGIAGGGGLLTLPALLHAGLPADLALGTNKGQSVFGSGAALLRFARAGQLAPRRSVTSFAAGFLGAAAGALVVSQVDKAALRPIVIALLFAAAFLIVLPRRTGAAAPRRPLTIAVTLALAIGFYDGFFGPGTGTLLIVGYMWLLAETPAVASANAKVVNFASNLASVLAFAATGLVVWSVSLPMAAGQFVGGTLGARIVLSRGSNVVRAVAVTVALAMVATLLVDVLRGG